MLRFVLYQHVRPNGRLIIHKASGWARQVNHSSACMFVTMVMEIDAPETLTLSQTALVEGGEVGCLFSIYQAMVAMTS